MHPLCGFISSPRMRHRRLPIASVDCRRLNMREYDTIENRAVLSKPASVYSTTLQPRCSLLCPISSIFPRCEHMPRIIMLGVVILTASSSKQAVDTHGGRKCSIRKFAEAFLLQKSLERNQACTKTKSAKQARNLRHSAQADSRDSAFPRSY
jgi:hypothetical protein